jgi:hypothetical protein
MLRPAALATSGGDAAYAEVLSNSDLSFIWALMSNAQPGGFLQRTRPAKRGGIVE